MDNTDTMQLAGTEDGPSNERPQLVLDPAEGDNAGAVLTDDQFQGSPSMPFKKWMDSFRAKKHHLPPGRRKHVEGWSEHSAEADMLSPSNTNQEQRSERCSGLSSNLGAVETTTLSTTSQIVSRSNTQSTRNRSIDSGNSVPAATTKSTMIPPLDEAAQSRAFKRRQVLQEIVATEFNYVLGLKVLSDVSLLLLLLLFFFFFC